MIVKGFSGEVNNICG